MRKKASPKKLVKRSVKKAGKRTPTKTIGKFKLMEEPIPSFSYELFRSEDMLYLKFFFFNAQIDPKYPINKHLTNIDKKEFLVYVMIPPQHIAEDLFTTIPPFTNRKELKAKSTFLSGNSWIAFRFLKRVKTIAFNQNDLLDWQGNFEMITLDDFEKDNGTNAYKDLAAELASNSVFREGSFQKVKNKLLPLSKFEAPYKMFLSPLAPADSLIDEKKRATGRFEFAKDNLKNLIYEKDNFRIVQPWENKLIYKTLGDKILNPHFKVIHYHTQNDDDNDGCGAQVDLLPAPVHRMELKGLTMQPQTDRDVRSDYFKFGSLGNTSFLKYKNDEPKVADSQSTYSIVAWEQEIKYARDNYAKITVRGIDILTGLKLLISIVAERKYKDGVSFLQKRYYVAYSEKEKTYDLCPGTISSMPFQKIIPRTTGRYFTPATNTNTFYGVATEGIDNLNTAVKDNLLDFEYTGIDKAGNEHNFTAKILFVLAEQYTITSGTYNYRLVTPPVAYTSGKPIPIQHIGQLNPAFHTSKTKRIPNPCPGGDVYTFTTQRVLNDPNFIRNYLKPAHDFILLYKNVFSVEINAEITYARIAGLKTIDDAVRKIRENSTAATFKTFDMLFFSYVNPDIKETDKDKFLHDFPLTAKLNVANVIISQIDQIEGQSRPRPVDFAPNYVVNQVDLDKTPESLLPPKKDQNYYKLLLRLVKNEQGFFTDNYKSSGAMANPGIELAFISALDNGIIYNEAHNASAPQAVKKKSTKDASTVPSLPALSVFSAFDAELLGIPVREIIPAFFPIEDMPVFNYLQEAEQSIQKINELIKDLSAIYGQWKGEYEKAVAAVEGLKLKVENLQNELLKYVKPEVATWVENLVELKNIRRQLKTALSAGQAIYQGNKAKLTKLYEKFLNDSGLDGNKLKTTLESMFNPAAVAYKKMLEDDTLDKHIRAQVDKLNDLIRGLPTKPAKDAVSELVKLYCILNTPIAAEKVKPRMIAALTELSAMQKEVSDEFKEYHTAILKGAREACNLNKNALETQLETIEKKILAAINDSEKELLSDLNKFIKNIDLKRINSVLLQVSELKNLYDHYHKIYNDVKAEYYNSVIPKSVDTAVVETYLTDAFKAEMKVLVDDIIAKAGDIPNIAGNVRDFKKDVESDLKNVNNWFTIREAEVKAIINNRVKEEMAKYTNIVSAANALIDTKKKELAKALDDLRIGKTAVEDLVRGKVKNVKADLEAELKNLAIEHEIPGSTEYNRIKQKIDKMQYLIRKMEEASKQKLHYTFRTRNFRKASLGGVIDFIPAITAELSVNVDYALEFDISEFNQPPKLIKQSFLTNSTLSNFKIGFLQLIFVDFEKVCFISGSDVKDDFKVSIRDVKFCGALDFVQAFQQYLNSISNNLVFDINAQRARISYAISLPDVTAGAFNFFNLSLAAMLTLPFDPKKALEIQFGIGSPLSKFGLTVSGIFGGQGYFNIIANPKQGVVGLEVVLEFGAIFKLNVGFAWGEAYLVGGIYIRKYYSDFELRGYILAVGRLNVLGIFSASASFYLGLHGDGHWLKGICTVTLSKRFSRFFEISVSCSYEKQLKGTKGGGSSASPLQMLIEKGKSGVGPPILDTNIHKTYFHEHDHLFMKLSFDNPNQKVPGWMIIDEKGEHVVKEGEFDTIQFSKGNDSCFTSFSLDLAKELKAGSYYFQLEGYGDLHKMVVMSDDISIWTTNTADQDKVTRKNYYKSYFKR
jgi:hypothetical protein